MATLRNLDTPKTNQQHDRNQHHQQIPCSQGPGAREEKTGVTSTGGYVPGRGGDWREGMRRLATRDQRSSERSEATVEGRELKLTLELEVDEE